MPGFELFGELEKQEVNDVLDNGVLMRYGFDGMRKGHWKAKALESELQNTFQSKHVQLVSSGTAAVSVALGSAGVGAGDEVIMPTFTFVASFEAIMMLGAIPVLADIDDTLGLNPEAVEAAITPKTKAIMVVQMCGSMANMDALKAIAEKHNLLLVEDACQAIGGTFNGQPLGSVGDLGCFSFDFVKTITCGEGGAVITNNEKYYTNADHYSDHGHDHVGSDRGAETHPFLGYNFRISELHAAVGLAQVKRLPEFLDIQRRNFNIIREALSTIPEVVFRTVPEGGVESCAFLNFFLPDLETSRKVIEAFKNGGVDACWNYFDNNWHYIRKWDHLKNLKSLFPISKEVKEGLEYLQTRTFEKSDHYISRNISCLIKLSWTEEEVKQRANKMAELIKSVL
ncbi:DegT/DnrJ/EryC1/StrS family aminotransferase [Algibacter lectus]|uniref:8-amino-3,8-dideoxy-alpha-D-manno-octulosonate transaminase n=1 Tax=Algibacter lectus TaxID=221126 RepID=A0A090X606_9FLAO|nr:DegT/DnrJ/EryC1/StrS family aminotransferase [Algibacter lectus]MDO7136155.1 DegT/DnrJ/EryC1/StrS family aminotransferase [Algibacter lectus]MWW23366.1 aminotransferase class I/II-fold pyridoxal phosphate-dependent enzyme [Algibacter lectus]TDY63957.1 8-amino-3,8-dideoxy-alpha-D-manno-octulosonate transaminase [Algibacter lectus]SFB82403.1 dTDP-4-amino-4,6-dideoxygalactose transaminase [Algibacter lectus]GAL61548.1 DegT/DnrJ/EryC1/StrS aminotransferase [Algibacter lectus]